MRIMKKGSKAIPRKESEYSAYKAIKKATPLNGVAFEQRYNLNNIKKKSITNIYTQNVQYCNIFNYIYKTYPEISIKNEQ